MVPRTGGNSMTGSFYAGWGPEALQGTNLTDELKAAGAAADAAHQELRRQRRGGGPILQDRLWFLIDTTAGTAQLFDMFYNKNQGLANVWTYEGRPVAPGHHRPREITTSICASPSQVTPRNKLNVFWDEQFICKSCENGSQQGVVLTESRAAGDHGCAGRADLVDASPVNNQVLD